MWCGSVGKARQGRAGQGRAGRRRQLVGVRVKVGESQNGWGDAAAPWMLVWMWTGRVAFVQYKPVYVCVFICVLYVCTVCVYVCHKVRARHLVRIQNTKWRRKEEDELRWSVIGDLSVTHSLTHSLRLFPYFLPRATALATLRRRGGRQTFIIHLGKNKTGHVCKLKAALRPSILTERTHRTTNTALLCLRNSKCIQKRPRCTWCLTAPYTVRYLIFSYWPSFKSHLIVTRPPPPLFLAWKASTPPTCSLPCDAVAEGRACHPRHPVPPRVSWILSNRQGGVCGENIFTNHCARKNIYYRLLCPSSGFFFKIIHPLFTRPPSTTPCHRHFEHGIFFSPNRQTRLKKQKKWGHKLILLNNHVKLWSFFFFFHFFFKNITSIHDLLHRLKNLCWWGVTHHIGKLQFFLRFGNEQKCTQNIPPPKWTQNMCLQAWWSFKSGDVLLEAQTTAPVAQWCAFYVFITLCHVLYIHTYTTHNPFTKRYTTTLFKS